jgi:hypothetical protein
MARGAREIVSKIVKGMKETRMIPKVPNSANDIQPSKTNRETVLAAIKQLLQ